MKKKIAYIRIGSDKAGTVSISRLVALNRAIFSKHYYYVPMRNCVKFLHYLREKFQLEGVPSFSTTRNSSNGPNSKGFEDLITNYDKYQNWNIFLTTEVIWGQLTKRDVKKDQTQIETFCKALKEFFYNHEVKLILHLRRADLYYESSYKQLVKAGSALEESFIDFYSKKNIAGNSLMFLKILENTFGRSNIKIIPMERQQFINGDLSIDLLYHLNLSKHYQDFQLVYANECLQRDLLETTAILNKTQGKLLSNEDLLSLSNRLKTKYNFADEKYVLARYEREQVLYEFRDFYQYIEENYKISPLFKDPLPNDDHLNYSLSQERFELIKSLMLENPKILSKVSV